MCYKGTDLYSVCFRPLLQCFAELISAAYRDKAEGNHKLVQIFQVLPTLIFSYRLFWVLFLSPIYFTPSMYIEGYIVFIFPFLFIDMRIYDKVLVKVSQVVFILVTT